MQPPAVLILGGQGYIGSALALHLEACGLTVQLCDAAHRGRPLALTTWQRPYQELTAADLQAFASIVLLAGHCSVAACDREPAAAFANNVQGFVELVHKLHGQKLIYASTISLYVQTHGRLAQEAGATGP